MSSNTVELNGKRYDAVTGTFLGSSRRPRLDKAGGILKSHHRGRSLDGFAHKSSPAINTAPQAPPSLLSTTALSHTSSKSHRHSMDGFAHTINNLVPHLPEHSLTLKRQAVSPPKLQMKPAIKKILPAEKHASVLHPITPKPSVSRVDQDRLAHAHQVARNRHVRHFSPNQAQVSTPRATAMPQPLAPAAPRPEQSEEDMFELAIAQATSHEQKAPKQRRSWKRKLANSGAVVLALLVIAIFTAYLNLPTIEVNIASRQAGFHVTMPNYKALGFAFESPIKTANGVVSMNFSSGDSKFTITQQASNWDNATLMDSLATQSDTIPKAVQSNGHTIYMTHTNQATWVNGGIRYDLTGNANLTAQQIMAVADSL